MISSYIARFERLKAVIEYHLFHETNKNIPLKKRIKTLYDLIDKNYITKKDELTEDINLSTMVSEDISKILDELPERDIYNCNLQKPVVRVLRNGNDIKIYGLLLGGGLLLYYKKSDSGNGDSFQIHSLGEDDGFYFLESRNLYEPIYCGKTEMVALLSEVLSSFNAIEK